MMDSQLSEQRRGIRRARFLHAALHQDGRISGRAQATRRMAPIKKKKEWANFPAHSDEKLVPISGTDDASECHQKKPRIAVITPYFKESTAILRQCRDSVRAQKVHAEIVHIMVADGFPSAQVDAWGVEHISLPRHHANNGNTSRAIGALLAEQKQSDFIAFLDADRWFHSYHLSSLVELQRQTGADICCAWESESASEQAPTEANAGRNSKGAQVSVSCLLFARSAFSLNLLWAQIPKEISVLWDRVLIQAIMQRQFSIRFSERTSVAVTAATNDQPEQRAATALIKASAVASALSYLASADGYTNTAMRLGMPITNLTTPPALHRGGDNK